MATLNDQKVIENILLKRELLEKGDPRAGEDIIVDMIIAPGAQFGAYGSGQGIALDDLGIMKVVRRIYGVSTGMWIAGYLPAGQIRDGAKVYCHDFSGSQFVKFWPLTRFLMNKDVIAHAAQFVGKNKLRMDAVLASPIELYAGLTTEDGAGIFINAKEARPDAWSAFYASSANPLGYEEAQPVNEYRYWDGGIALQCPITEVYQECKRNFRNASINILVLPNVPCPPKIDFTSLLKERLFCEIAMRRHVPKHIRALIYERKRRFIHDLARAHYLPSDAHVFVLWPPDCGLHAFTTDRNHLQRAVEESARHALEIFGESGKEISISW